MNDSHPHSMAKRFHKMNSVPRLRIAAGLAALVGVFVAAGTMASCTADDGVRPRGYSNGEGGGSTTSGVGTSSGNVDPNAPCVSGTAAECHLTIGVNEGILTCLHGERQCAGGNWGPCTGDFASKMTPENARIEVGDEGAYHVLGLSDAGPCQNNPCDPYCQDYEEVPLPDGGYQVVPTIESTYYTGSLADALALTPPGFVQKGMQTPCNITADCQFDSHCLPTGTNGIDCGSGIPKCCMAWGPNEWDTTCNKPDPTTGFACTQTINGQKVPTIPVCNRGSVVLPAPTRIYVFPGNSAQFPLCIPDKDPYVCDTSVPVAPGKCINVIGCPGLTGNGTKSIMINGPTNGGGGNAPNNPNWRNECTCENNWGVWSGNNTPCYEKFNYAAQPLIKNQVYQALCPVGTRPQWQYLTWDTTTPLDSTVVWEGRVAATNALLSSASYIGLGTARASPNNQICSAAGPTGCPINLFTTFGGSPTANSEFLEVRITMNPTSDKSAGAQVNNWLISYTCPPAQ